MLTKSKLEAIEEEALMYSGKVPIVDFPNVGPGGLARIHYAKGAKAEAEKAQILLDGLKAIQRMFDLAARKKASKTIEEYNKLKS